MKKKNLKKVSETVFKESDDNVQNDVIRTFSPNPTLKSG